MIQPASSPEGPETVSVVICCYSEERWEALVRAIESVRRQSHPADQLVIVVDGNPALHRRLCSVAPGADIVLLAERSGLSAARNAGIMATRCEFVAFLDDDAEAEPEWLRYLCGAMRDPGTVGAGGRSDPRWEGPRPAWFSEALLWTVGCTYAGLSAEAGTVRNVFGGCACYRRSLFERVGGFRTDLGRGAKGAGGAEETELCVRAARMLARARFAFEPRAGIHHLVPRDRARVGYVLRRSYAEGQAKAVLVHLAGWSALATEGAYVRRLSGGLGSSGAIPAIGGGAVAALSVATAAAGLTVGLARRRPRSGAVPVLQPSVA